MQEVLCVLKPGGGYILSDTGVGRKIQEIIVDVTKADNQVI